MRLALLLVGLFAGCVPLSPPPPCTDCEGEGEGEGDPITGEGEGEGEPCTAPAPDPSWSGESGVDYSQCNWGDALESPCADDSCVDGAEEAQLVEVVRSLASERGYGDKIEITDVTFEDIGGGMSAWSVSLMLSVDWLRCRLGAAADGSEHFVPERSDVEYMLPHASEVPVSVPAPDVVEAAMQACDADASLRPCESTCAALIGRPAGEDQCGDVRYFVSAARAGEMSCPDGSGQPPDSCDIPDDWQCDWRSYVSPLCSCQSGGTVVCPHYIAPSCWTCSLESFNDFTCDTGCGAADPACQDAGPGGGAEGEGEGEGARACQPSPWEYLCQ